MPNSGASTDEDAAEGGGAAASGSESDAGEAGGLSEESSLSTEELRRRVEAEYDFEDFGPTEMEEMTAEEWAAVFDAESWITGADLLDRVEVDLRQRVADRDVFAKVERREDRVVAYSDAGYAVVSGDGTVEGEGTVLRDVKPVVALCSMADYEVPESAPENPLPNPEAVPEGQGELGNKVLQAVAAAQVLAGVALLGAWLLGTLQVVSLPGPSGGGENLVLVVFAGVAFLLTGVFLFVVVANARLSDAYRAAEFRDRLRAIQAADPPAELPGEAATGTEDVREAGDGGSDPEGSTDGGSV